MRTCGTGSIKKVFKPACSVDGPLSHNQFHLSLEQVPGSVKPPEGRLQSVSMWTRDMVQAKKVFKFFKPTCRVDGPCNDIFTLD